MHITGPHCACLIQSFANKNKAGLVKRLAMAARIGPWGARRVRKVAAATASAWSGRAKLAILTEAAALQRGDCHNCSNEEQAVWWRRSRRGQRSQIRSLVERLNAL